MDPLKFPEKSNNPSLNILYHINKLYVSHGNDRQDWINLLCSVYESNSYNDIISYFIQALKNDPSNILTLDIIDFLVDYGTKNLIKEISTVNFMINIFNLLKKHSGASLDVQKKGIYLTQKWNNKALQDPYDYENGFTKNFNELQKHGITFPPRDYLMPTYNRFISISEANSIKENILNQNNPKIPLFNPFNVNNGDYLEEINKHPNYIPNNNDIYNQNNSNEVSVNLEEYKKDWIIKMKELNKWIDMGELCYEKEKLKMGIKSIVNEFGRINNLLVIYLREGKTESNNILQKIKSDMEQTCSRYEKFLKSKNNEPFFSAFAGNNKKYYYNRANLNVDGNNKLDQKNKYIQGIEKIGGMLKNGIFTVGRTVKDGSIKGFNYIVDKITKEEPKKKTEEEIWKEYMEKNNLNRK